MKKPNIQNTKDSYIINNRYAIYKDCGVVYDTVKAKDIPQYIFKLRDKLLGHNTCKSASNGICGGNNGNNI